MKRISFASFARLMYIYRIYYLVCFIFKAKVRKTPMQPYMHTHIHSFFAKAECGSCSTSVKVIHRHPYQVLHFSLKQERNSNHQVTPRRLLFHRWLCLRGNLTKHATERALATDTRCGRPHTKTTGLFFLQRLLLLVP